MIPELPDIKGFETDVFKDDQVFSRLLDMALALTGGLQAGLVQGTDATGESFLDPANWDRGIIRTIVARNHEPKSSGSTTAGTGISEDLPPVSMYRFDDTGKRSNNEGIIAYVLRHFQDFYSRGIRVLLITGIEKNLDQVNQDYATFPIVSFDGAGFFPQTLLKANTAIIRRFFARNFIAAYVPDYGAVVINTADNILLEKQGDRFVRQEELIRRLNLMIQCIQTASLAILGHVKGPRGAELLWRKERQLRKTAQDLSRQRSYLRAVGGVTVAQLTMEPRAVDQGVYAFVDMVGSVRFRQSCRPREYLFATNLFRQIGADLADHFSCRLANFLGDGLFFQNVSLFDAPEASSCPAIGERTALMVLVVSSLLREMDLLEQGEHPSDPGGTVRRLVDGKDLRLEFRAGIHVGPAFIGPVGSQHRMMVTAIGEGVDTASRLESSGIPGFIHISQETMTLLEPVRISRRTPLLHTCITKGYPGDIPMFRDENKALLFNPDMDFLKWYAAGFPEDSEIIHPFGPVAFKEFFRDKTVLLHWNRRAMPCLPPRA
ncbi:MAG: adenylate/guanylate cyclase domain-containing protein [Pseudomonadota bacterium]